MKMLLALVPRHGAQTEIGGPPLHANIHQKFINAVLVFLNF